MASISSISTWLISTTRMWVAIPRKNTTGSSVVKAGARSGWVAADEAYGQNTPLRDWLEEHDLSYVLAVPKSFTAATAAGPNRADELAARGARWGTCGRAACRWPHHGSRTA